MLTSFLALVLTTFARVITGANANWVGCLPESRPRIYYANHASHGDFLLIWSVLPASLRRLTRPVAGADYWGADRVRRYVGGEVFQAVLIERNPTAHGSHPIAVMTDVLKAGSSLILFPEGTRNTTEAPLLPFKSGLHHLARSAPDVELVPVWLENLNRVMPKGEFLPLPLLCTVTFGAPLAFAPGEPRAEFLARTEAALLALRTVRE